MNFWLGLAFSALIVGFVGYTLGSKDRCVFDGGKWMDMECVR